MKLNNEQKQTMLMLAAVGLWLSAVSLCAWGVYSAIKLW